MREAILKQVEKAVELLKQCYKELGRTPSSDEFWRYASNFDIRARTWFQGRGITYSDLIRAAHLPRHRRTDYAKKKLNDKNAHDEIERWYQDANKKKKEAIEELYGTGLKVIPSSRRIQEFYVTQKDGTIIRVTRESFSLR